MLFTPTRMAKTMVIITKVTMTLLTIRNAGKVMEEVEGSKVFEGWCKNGTAIPRTVRQLLLK